MNHIQFAKGLLKYFILRFSLLNTFIITKLKSSLFFHKQYQLRVLTYHDVPRASLGVFRNHLTNIKRDWHFLTPDEFILIKSKRLPLTRNSLLLTLDDGFLSNYDLAMSVLDDLNIKAVFFVVTTFIESKSSYHAQKIVNKSIIPGQVKSSCLHTYSNMTTCHLRSLIACGHEIGSHTLTHPFISSLRSPLSVYSEIVNSKKRLSSMLNIDVRFFAFPFGSYKSISLDAIKLALEHYTITFTSLRGNNELYNGRVCFRETISLDESQMTINSYLHGAADFLYHKNIKLLLSSLNQD